MIRSRFFLIGFIIFFFSASLVFGAKVNQEKDPKALDSQAKHNYYMGEYYYSLGRYDDAEVYFQKSRDMIEKKKDILADKKRPVKKSAKEEDVPQPAALEYLIGDGDVLYVSVWQNEDLNQEIIVRPDGKISFPLVGEMQAVGLTLSKLTKDLTLRLKEFVKFPQVSVSIRRFGGSKVIILGQVGHPGVFAVSGKKTVLEAIALAGGFGPDAVAKSVILIRGGFQNPKAERLNLVRAMLGTNMAGNISLKSEDIIFVPKSFISNLNEAASKIMDLASRGSMTYNILDTVGGR